MSLNAGLNAIEIYINSGIQMTETTLEIWEFLFHLNQEINRKFFFFFRFYIVEYVQLEQKKAKKNTYDS